MSDTQTRTTYFRRKKEFVSFLLSVLVLFIHISSFTQYPPDGGVITAVNERAAFFFQESITRFSVPMFYILSGITFFRDYDNSKYPKKLNSRFFTLLIPYLLWNILGLLFQLLCSHPFIARFFTGRKPFRLTLPNVLKAVFFYSCNLPFWFIFNLIVFVIASPLIYAVIRNKYIGIASVVLLSILSLFGIHLPASLFYSPYSIIFYMIGGILGRHFFHFISEKSGKPLQYGSMAFLVLYVIVKNLIPTQLYLENTPVLVTVFCLCSFAIWNVADALIERIKPRTLYSRSFLIYAMHVNISAIITKLIVLCLPRTEWLAIPNFIATAILTLLTINLLATLWERHLPAAFSLLTGKRLRN